MIAPVRQHTLSAEGRRFAIVASQYNREYVDGMLSAAQALLASRGAAAVEVVRVPGAFEIPVIVARLARRAEPPDAILALGLILRGDTAHADHVGDAVTHALMGIAVATCVPVVHEVLLMNDLTHAPARCMDPETNKGAEAALTAIAMTMLRDSA
ncbi:MAG: 6,7-dimethyl-8-ribityllumazine synthase [Limisphaerales bacterium]